MPPKVGAPAAPSQRSDTLSSPSASVSPSGQTQINQIAVPNQGRELGAVNHPPGNISPEEQSFPGPVIFHFASPLARRATPVPREVKGGRNGLGITQDHSPQEENSNSAIPRSTTLPKSAHGLGVEIHELTRPHCSDTKANAREMPVSSQRLPEEGVEFENLYKRWVPEPLRGTDEKSTMRRDETIKFYRNTNGFSVTELKALLETSENWQAGRTWGQGATVFTFGFFLLSAYAYATATHGVKHSNDSELNQIGSFVAGCVIAGCGGVFGSNIITHGGLEPKYFTPMGVKDGKAVPFIDTLPGKLVEYSSFWGFAVGHPLVEVMFKDRPDDKVAKAAAKWASACAATMVTCLHKQWMPRWFLPRDPVLLDASTAGKKAALTSLIRDMQRNTPVRDYAKQWGRGLASTVGFPRTREAMRALAHTLMAGIALAGMLASQLDPEHRFALAVAGSVWIGLSWGVLSRAARVGVQEIEQGGADQVRLEMARVTLPGVPPAPAQPAQAARVSQVAPPSSPTEYSLSVSQLSNSLTSPSGASTNTSTPSSRRSLLGSFSSSPNPSDA